MLGLFFEDLHGVYVFGLVFSPRVSLKRVPNHQNTTFSDHVLQFQSTTRERMKLPDISSSISPRKRVRANDIYDGKSCFERIFLSIRDVGLGVGPSPSPPVLAAHSGTIYMQSPRVKLQYRWTRFVAWSITRRPAAPKCTPKCGIPPEKTAIRNLPTDTMLPVVSKQVGKRSRKHELS